MSLKEDIHNDYLLLQETNKLLIKNLTDMKYKRDLVLVEIVELKRENERLKGELEATTKENEIIKEKQQKYAASIETLIQENNILKHDLACFTTGSSTLSQENEQLKKENKILKEGYNVAQSTKKDLYLEIANLKEINKDLEDRNYSLFSLVKQHEEKIDCLAEMVNTRIAEIDQKDEEIEGLNNEIMEKEHEIERLKKELAPFKEKIPLSVFHINLAKENKELKKQIADYRDTLTKEGRTMHAKDEEIEALKKKIDFLSGNALPKRYLELQKENEELQNRLNNLLSFNDPCGEIKMANITGGIWVDNPACIKNSPSPAEEQQPSEIYDLIEQLREYDINNQIGYFYSNLPKYLREKLSKFLKFSFPMDAGIHTADHEKIKQFYLEKIKNA